MEMFLLPLLNHDIVDALNPLQLNKIEIHFLINFSDLFSKHDVCFVS